MIVLVNPMWSVKNVNSDSCYYVIRTIVEKFIELYPDYYFIIPFPVSKGFNYYRDGFFDNRNILRIPKRYPLSKKQNNMDFDSTFYMDINKKYGVSIIWNHIPEVGGHLRYLLDCFTWHWIVVNQHHYIIHKSLPYPIDSSMQYVYMQLVGDQMVDWNLFNSNHCLKMTLDNIQAYLPNLEKSILEKSQVLHFGLIDPVYMEKHRKPKNKEFTFVYNHRLQNYKQWRTTFALFDELYKAKFKFKVLVTLGAGKNYNAVNQKPYVILKELPTKEQYLEELSRCHVNTFNSLHETFCISILESMFYNIPCIVPNSTTMPELLGENNPQLFNNQKEQKSMLIDLMKNPKRIKKYGDYNHNRAKEFSLEKYCHALHDVFENQLDAKRNIGDEIKPRTFKVFTKLVNEYHTIKLDDALKIINRIGLANQSMPMSRFNLFMRQNNFTQTLQDGKTVWTKK